MMRKVGMHLIQLKKNLEGFIDQLNTQQFKTIESFFDTMPKLSHINKVTNPKTGVKSDVVLEGLLFSTRYGSYES